MKTTDIRTIEWDTTNLGGTVLAQICPICAAHVPRGNDSTGLAYRERHIRFHDFRNEVLQVETSERIEA